MEYVYAALLLHKLGKNVNEDNIKKVVQSAGAEVNDSKVKSLIASLKDVDIAKELENASLAVAPVGDAESSGEAKTEEKKEKPKEEEKAPAAEGLSALFG